MAVRRFLGWPRLLSSLLTLVFLGWVAFPLGAIAQPPAPASTTTTTPPDTIQPYLDRVQQQVTEFRLDNGLKFIVLERHQAPVISFLTYANVGGVDEPNGKTGEAHFLEHLAFKGTRRIGTRDYEAEKKLLDRLDQLFGQIKALCGGTVNCPADPPAGVTKLKAEFKQTQAAAMRYVNQNELGRIVEEAGGVGLNANTSADATQYFYSFPANKLELWMSLESERFLEPVFREFYEEKEVILEERRMRVENSPVGQLFQAVTDKAFQVHPYKRPVIGYEADLRNLSRQDVEAFFSTHYGPSSLAIALVGDVNPVEVKRLAEVYFGRYPAKPVPAKTFPPEPPQTQTQEVTLRLPSQPIYVEAYHRPAMNHPDHGIYELINSLLSDGRTSRLYQSLVEKQGVALGAQGFSGYPGDKYPNLLIFYGVTAPGHSLEELSQGLHQEIERLKTQPVSALELERVKTQARVSLLSALKSNQGMASLLLDYEIKTGSWKNLFRELDAIASITPADIQRVSQATFTPENRTVGRLLPPAPSTK